MENNKTNLIYPELSYKIIGVAFDIFNDLGFGHIEIYYQRAFAKKLEKLGISFEREKRFSICYEGDIIGTYILDFLIDNKLVVELKVRPKIGYTHIKQVVSYLRSANLKLAIIIYFTKEGVKYRRIINANSN